MSEFEFTPEDAQPIAIVVAKDLRRQRFTVQFEKPPYENAPYRASVVGTYQDKKAVVEAQFSFDFHPELRELATWLMLRRAYVETYIATVPDASINPGVLHEMRELGVGLFFVEDEIVQVS